MKKNIIKKLNTIFSIIALVFSISVVAYADDATSGSGIVGIGEKQGDEQFVVDPKDLTIDDFPEFYKTFIIELGGERMQVFNSTGAKVYEKVVLPAEFKGKSNITLKNNFIRNEQTIILANEYSIGLGGYAFSNNIPCLTFKGDKYDTPYYILFKSWTNMTTSIAEWCSNPENAKNLVADINDNVLNEAVGNDILTFLSGGGLILILNYLAEEKHNKYNIVALRDKNY